MITNAALTAKLEPFDTFWEGPKNVEKGYTSLRQFYKANYQRYLPARTDARILVISCGPGYFVHMLLTEGYTRVQGIDSMEEKVRPAKAKHLPCDVAEAFPFLEAHVGQFDAIICEQELNHLTKEEIQLFLERCRESLTPGGMLIAHSLNGANPITGAEALAQNVDHYNTFTEYSLRQVLHAAGFDVQRVIPLNLYVFYTNPFNYVAWAASSLLTLAFQLCFLLYGKSNRLFTKKIAAISVRAA